MLLLQNLAQHGDKLIDKSFTVSENPALALLVGWQSFVIIILGIAVWWLIKDKAKTTREFVSALTHVNNAMDKVADIIKSGDGNITDQFKDIERRLLTAIKEAKDDVKESIQNLRK